MKLRKQMLALEDSAQLFKFNSVQSTRPSGDEYPQRRRNTRKQGQLYRMINGVKCFVKYEIIGETCEVTAFAKIYSKPMVYVFEDINKDFKPIAAIRRLQIKFNLKREPFLEEYIMLTDAFVESFPDTLYFMLPTHVVSYLYGS